MKVNIEDQWRIIANLGNECNRWSKWRDRGDLVTFNAWCDEYYGCQPFPKKDKTGDLLITDEKKFLLCMLKHNHPW